MKKKEKYVMLCCHCYVVIISIYVFTNVFTKLSDNSDVNVKMFYFNHERTHSKKFLFACVRLC